MVKSDLNAAEGLCATPAWLAVGSSIFDFHRALYKVEADQWMVKTGIPIAVMVDSRV